MIQVDRYLLNKPLSPWRISNFENFNRTSFFRSSISGLMKRYVRNKGKMSMINRFRGEFEAEPRGQRHDTLRKKGAKAGKAATCG